MKVPDYFTKPYWSIDILSDIYLFNLLTNLSSINFNKGLKTTIGLNSCSLGILGCALFKGISRSLNNDGFKIYV